VHLEGIIVANVAEFIYLHR